MLSLYGKTDPPDHVPSCHAPHPCPEHPPSYPSLRVSQPSRAPNACCRRAVAVMCLACLSCASCDNAVCGVVVTEPSQVSLGVVIHCGLDYLSCEPLGENWTREPFPVPHPEDATGESFRP